jgi:hypothetical protein
MELPEQADTDHYKPGRCASETLTYIKNAETVPKTTSAVEPADRRECFENVAR